MCVLKFVMDNRWYIRHVFLYVVTGPIQLLLGYVRQLIR